MFFIVIGAQGKEHKTDIIEHFPRTNLGSSTIIIPTILMRKLLFREVRNLPKVTQQGGGGTRSQTEVW